MKKFTNLTLIFLIGVFFVALSCGDPPADDQQIDSNELLDEVGDDETQEENAEEDTDAMDEEENMDEE